MPQEHEMIVWKHGAYLWIMLSSIETETHNSTHMLQIYIF